ncbi:MAG: hypothetical protein WC992_00260 [Acholeplasmataceae bacterium]
MNERVEKLAMQTAVVRRLRGIKTAAEETAAPSLADSAVAGFNAMPRGARFGAVGAGVGGLAGLLTAAMSKKKKKDYWHNALMGLMAGGFLGFGADYLPKVYNGTAKGMSNDVNNPDPYQSIAAVIPGVDAAGNEVFQPLDAAGNPLGDIINLQTGEMTPLDAGFKPTGEAHTLNPEGRQGWGGMLGEAGVMAATGAGAGLAGNLGYNRLIRFPRDRKAYSAALAAAVDTGVAGALQSPSTGAAPAVRQLTTSANVAGALEALKQFNPKAYRAFQTGKRTLLRGGASDTVSALRKLNPKAIPDIPLRKNVVAVQKMAPKTVKSQVMDFVASGRKNVGLPTPSKYLNNPGGKGYRAGVLIPAAAAFGLSLMGQHAEVQRDESLNNAYLNAIQKRRERTEAKKIEAQSGKAKE